MSLPEHLGIIMDGNGRWARSRNHHRVFGHIRGAKTAKSIIEECSRLGLKALTLYAFSTENWKRPEEEVHFLMRLLTRQLKKERKSLIINNIRFHCIGEIQRLPKEVQAEVINTIRETAHCTGMNLVFALSYGGRQEIVSAVRDIAKLVKAGRLDPDEIDEDLLSSSLETSFLPEPDLIIRTSGEWRLSNFLLWQGAYSELYMTKKMWPDFSKQDLQTALADYSGRVRRFGKTNDQIEQTL